jgi:hypothetical protein
MDDAFGIDRTLGKLIAARTPMTRSCEEDRG